jgi:hypothetical protein
MKNIISLVVGDWSGDGHDKKDIINIESNFDKKAIDLAYKLGTEKLGFDFCNHIAEEYEDNKLPNEEWKKLKEAGYQDDNGLEEDAKKYNDGEISLDISSFADIYLFIVKLGNEKFKFEYLEGNKNPQINIGGYGLFT